jgi:hypothetical protein
MRLPPLLPGREKAWDFSGHFIVFWKYSTATSKAMARRLWLSCRRCGNLPSYYRPKRINAMTRCERSPRRESDARVSLSLLAMTREETPDRKRNASLVLPGLQKYLGMGRKTQSYPDDREAYKQPAYRGIPESIKACSIVIAGKIIERRLWRMKRT